MNISEFAKPVTAKTLNESLAKRFGAKLNLQQFTLEQLQNARNKLRTQLFNVETNESFNSVQNETYQKSKLMLDVLNAELSERGDIDDESIEEAGKPDFLDLDKDGDKKEPMKKAAKDKKSKGIKAMVDAGNKKADAEAKEKDVDEGKSPHKKGTKKYKKHMAAMHAEGEMSEGPFKGIGKQLMKRKLNKQYKKADLANFDKSGIDTKGKTPDEVGQMKSDYYHDNMDKADRAKKASNRLSKKNESYKDYLGNKLSEAVTEIHETASTCPECGNTKANEGDEYVAEKQRLDPKCWKGKKIGSPKTKMKGGVRVNNCVPA